MYATNDLKVPKYLVLMVLIIGSVAVAGCQRSSQVSKLGFDHPRLHELARSKPIKVEAIERIKWDKTNKENLDTQRDHGTFVAVVSTNQEDSSFGPARSLLLFRLHRGKPVLLWESEPQFNISLYSDDGFRGGQLDAKEFDGLAQNGFSDRNQNSLPDLAFGVSNGGNCSDCGSVILLELTLDDQVRDITPNSDLNPNGLIDLNDDWKIEVITTDHHDADFGSNSHAGSPYESRVYEWQGDSYKEASVKFASYYDRKNAELKDRIKRTYDRRFISSVVSPLLAQMFFNYEAIQRTEEGWKEVVSLGNLENWEIKPSRSNETKYRRVLNRLRKRVR